MTEGLSCTCRIPFVWHTAEVDEETRRGLYGEAGFLLAALNQMEGVHEFESSGSENRRLERLEAKLDLTLHLLARALEPNAPPERQAVTITPQGAQWQEADPPAEGTTVVLELRLSDLLPLTLKLPTRALAARDGQARVAFDKLPESLDDALYQFVFRRHRQAIRARA